MRLKKKKDILGRKKTKIVTEDGVKYKVVLDKNDNVIKKTIVRRDEMGVKKRTTIKTKPGKKKKKVDRGGYARPFPAAPGLTQMLRLNEK